MRHPERRGAPRVASRLPLTLTRQAEEFVTRTKNISASGAYCQIPRFVAPMTKLQVWLEIPSRSHPARIECQGVVVRVEPSRINPHPARYHVAIFFSDLADRDRSIIARYVQQQLRITPPPVSPPQAASAQWAELRLRRRR